MQQRAELNSLVLGNGTLHARDGLLGHFVVVDAVTLSDSQGSAIDRHGVPTQGVLRGEGDHELRSAAELLQPLDRLPQILLL